MKNITNETLSNLPKGFVKATITSKFDNLPIHLYLAKPDKEPTGILQLVHGMCEHKERYISYIDYMKNQGFVVVIHDHRGHGQSILSDNDLGFFYNGGYHAMIEDVKLVYDFVRKDYPSQKIYLFGHSMGSLVVRSFVKKYDNLIDGLIVCGSPSYSPLSSMGLFIAKQKERRKGDHFRSKTLQKLTFGTYNKNIPDANSPNSWLTTDKTIVEKFDTDYKCNYIFTTNGFKNLYRLLKDTYSKKNWNMKNPELPIWFISGEEDPCKAGSKKFYSAVNFMKKLGYKNVTSTLYEGMWHEILNEINKIKVWEDISNQLKNSW